MQFQQVIPADITNLPNYSVPGQLFVCTTIVLFVFLFFALAFLIIWIIRIHRKIFNPDYMIDFQVKYETVKTMQNINNDDDVNIRKQINLDDLPKCARFNRVESRMLEFACVSVIVAINIGTFTCTIMEAVCFVVAFVLFVVFNLLRICDSIKFLRLIWLLPMLAAYLPFYIFRKSLITS